jgi:hypothetical protein
MVAIQDVSAEELARIFHHYREALVHVNENRGGEEAVADSWEHTAPNERKLMVAAARLALLELATSTAPARPSRKYFAEPGKAEWGA